MNWLNRFQVTRFVAALCSFGLLFAAACGDGPDPPPTEAALPTLTPLPNVGDCLNSQPVAIRDVVPCDSAAAYFKVLAIDRGTGERVCPPETDASSTWIGSPVSLCLAKLK